MPDVRIWFRDSRWITMAQQEAWWAAYCQRDDDQMYAILNEPGAVVGFAGLANVTPESAEIGRLVVAHEHRGQHIAREAISSLVAVAANSGTNRVWADIIPGNEPSLKAFAAAGFRKCTQTPDGLIRVWRKTG